MSVTDSRSKTILSSELSTAWIPRAVRCPRCESLAEEQFRERFEDKIAVRYACPVCRWERVRYYLEKSPGEEGQADTQTG